MSGGFTLIPGRGGYAATRDGRIWSVTSNWRGYGPRELKQEIDRQSYRTVRLKVGNGVRKRLKVHRLIAEAFLGPRPSPRHQLRHLDGDQSNNSDENLAWGTAKDNADDRQRHGRTSRGPSHGAAIRAAALTKARGEV